MDVAQTLVSLTAQLEALKATVLTPDGEAAILVLEETIDDATKSLAIQIYVRADPKAPKDLH